MGSSKAAVCVFLAGAVIWGAGKDRGQETFERRCAGCHALDHAKVGPPLKGVFGRPAARDPQFPYSDALKKARLEWNPETLDSWLSDPDTLVPGTDMSFRLANRAERAEIIAYLKQLRTP